MDWLNNLIWGNGIAHSIFILTLVVAVGIYIGEKAKFKGITLGITWILFAAIACSHFGMRLDPLVESFAKDLGLILFVYSIGLQVGPSFFSSFRKGGVTLNLLAISIVLLGCLTAVIIHFATDIPMATMTGVLYGAVTNTPGLGAAEQTYLDTTGMTDPSIASGYAIAYPLGVVGILTSIVLLRLFFNIKNDKEEARVAQEKGEDKQIKHIDILLTNPQVEGIRVCELSQITHVKLIVSRLIHVDGTDEMPGGDTILHVGDKIRMVGGNEDERTMLLLGEPTTIPEDGKDETMHLISKHVVVTKSKLNGKRIGDLNIRAAYHITITRIRRAGIELLATPDLILQLGDRLTIVGKKNAVEKVAEVFGNKTKRLDSPNLASLFFGILLGVLIGSIPIHLPGLGLPFKLGLAGGALIVSILIGAFGPKMHLVTYTTSSANLMIREIGIALFLASVGFGAGKTFIPTLLDGGYMWIAYGVIITIIPLLIVGLVARLWCKMDYFTIMGLIAGSTTDPPALAYATAQSSVNDRAAVAYSTVYPVTMFLRVLMAQILILLFV
ncbi:MAG: putative transporter [Paludibacteraceae bacterium]|nr:putative transporter [Paludibacteraceae bacterium]